MLKLKLKKSAAKEEPIITAEQDEKAETVETPAELVGETNGNDDIKERAGETENAAENALNAVSEDVFAVQAVKEPTAIEVKSETSLDKPAEKGVKADKAKKYDADFSRLADILGKDEDLVIEECKIFQIKNVMARLSKAVVRYGVENVEMKTLLSDAEKSGLGEIAVAPAYLDGVAKSLSSGEEFKVAAVVDFPFGESSFKVKFAEIKNAVKKGVDGVLTVLNTAALNKDNAKPLKKELKKIGKLKAVETGVAINAEDAATSDVKHALKLAEKAGIDYAAFLFGSVGEGELSAKIKEIKDLKSKIKIKVMANVEDVKGVKTLIGLGVDGIITPFADGIAKELFKDFKIKSVKLG